MIKKYDKLVRDKIPSIVGDEGQICVYEVCSGAAELKEYTRNKVLEEAEEVHEAFGRDQFSRDG